MKEIGQGEQTALCMCASCWRIQAPEDELAFEMDQWVDPTTFMAQACGGERHFRLMDGYCETCLSGFLNQLRDVKTKGERLNA